MSWEYQYNPESDDTTIYWVGESETKQSTVAGKITRWKDGYPMGQGREVVTGMIQSAGTPERIRMQFDLNYGFAERDSEQS